MLRGPLQPDRSPGHKWRHNGPEAQCQHPGEGTDKDGVRAGLANCFGKDHVIGMALSAIGKQLRLAVTKAAIDNRWDSWVPVALYL